MIKEVNVVFCIADRRAGTISWYGSYGSSSSWVQCSSPYSFYLH